MIVLYIITLIICLLLCWLLTSTFILEIDSRLPRAMIKWGSIGKLIIWYEEEWWLTVKIFFYNKKIRLAVIKRRRKKINQNRPGFEKQKKVVMLKKMIKVIRTSTVEEWQFAIDTEDYCLNGKLYPLNFMPYCYEHININFADDNFLYLRLKNQPWRMLYVLLH